MIREKIAQAAGDEAETALWAKRREELLEASRAIQKQMLPP